MNSEFIKALENVLEITKLELKDNQDFINYINSIEKLNNVTAFNLYITANKLLSKYKNSINLDVLEPIQTKKYNTNYNNQEKQIILNLKEILKHQNSMLSNALACKYNEIYNSNISSSKLSRLAKKYHDIFEYKQMYVKGVLCTNITLKDYKASLDNLKLTDQEIISLISKILSQQSNKTLTARQILSINMELSKIFKPVGLSLFCTKYPQTFSLSRDHTSCNLIKLI